MFFKRFFVLILICIILISAIFFRENESYGIYSEQEFHEVKEMIKKDEQRLEAYIQFIELANNYLKRKANPVDYLYIPPTYVDNSGHAKARKDITEDAYASYILGLAWKLTDQEIYAEKAIDILNHWSKTNKQISAKDDTPLVAANSGIGFIYSATLLHDYKKWDQSQFRKWVESTYLPTIQFARNRSNNWANWGNLASLTTYSYLGDKSKLEKEVMYTKKIIVSQIDANGKMKEEVARKAKSMRYTYFALAPLTQSAFLIYNETNTNLFDLNSLEGKRIKAAFDKLYNAVENPNNWQYYTKTDLEKPNMEGNNNWPGSLIEAMSHIYPQENYNHLITQYRPILGGYIANRGPHHLAWNFPTLIPPIISN
ncbi:alginate lyase family protein [Metabacillus hrfriensis]|uniref:Alginate lyase family protein n=1 Tax=Metabacillus hrfriensis TaxID=3048891 RepID=A0ACD4RAW7_9BACI|nr:alginate lyase family protein [Metabacillus sp. CT-WN-B3]WHZ57588.1 alginate lyase family protein [Metabacillus sp. CT-WN-B3]